jgi:hypothetical protein
MILEEEGEEVKGKRLEVECWEWESSRETIFFLEKKCFFLGYSIELNSLELNGSGLNYNGIGFMGS